MNFFDNFSGHWITKKSIFIHKYNAKYAYEEKIKIIKNNYANDIYNYQSMYNINNKNVNLYFNIFNLDCSNNSLNKKTKIIKNQYRIKKNNHDLLKVHLNLNNNLTYNEYIYFINKNFNTSISFIKENKNYLVTIFTSYIKVYS
uniref:Uncharacterized protein n=1 Tax=Caloglossa beccarii TaxID=131038 RepID=A0A1Z1M8F4_9FLOR|nr:hypothetical protein [Caloglossa beccarii]ARW62266.1 hypothetical protein [Caloglossa beccarii]